MIDSYGIYDGETQNRLSYLMYGYCLMEDYPSYEEAKEFFLKSIRNTVVYRDAALMPPKDTAEYVYQEMLVDIYLRSEFTDLVGLVHGIRGMSCAPQVDRFEGEARKILLENGESS